MISITKPTLEQQVRIAVETEFKQWFADPVLGSELYKVNQLKITPQNFQTIKEGLKQAVAHLSIELKAWVENGRFCYSIKEIEV